MRAIVVLIVMARPWNAIVVDEMMMVDDYRAWQTSVVAGLRWWTDGHAVPASAAGMLQPKLAIGAIRRLVFEYRNPVSFPPTDRVA